MQFLVNVYSCLKTRIFDSICTGREDYFVKKNSMENLKRKQEKNRFRLYQNSKTHQIIVSQLSKTYKLIEAFPYTEKSDFNVYRF